MPQIGDNDNGQFIKLYPRKVLDMGYLLALGAVFFKEPKWKIKEFFNSDEDIAEVMILYGEKGMKSFEERLENLEGISEKLKAGKVPLEKAIELFEEGMNLSKSLEKDLSKIERKVEILVNEPEKKGDTPELELFPELENDT